MPTPQDPPPDVDTAAPEVHEADPIVISEYDPTPPLRLSEPARTYLRDEINGGRNRDGDRISVTYTHDGAAILNATSYVGLVSLPEGPTIEIQPKVPATNLLHILKYATNITAQTYEQETELQAGNLFVEALAVLYERELQRVRRRGLHTGYVDRQAAEHRLRGRLNIQRQLNRQPPVPTKFECDYQELTPDIPINQGILRVTELLTSMVSTEETTHALQRHAHALRRQVTRTPITATELAHVELTRLNDYYENILRLTKLFLRNSHIGDFTTGSRTAFSLLVNMNTVFERAVERAAETAITDRGGWRVTRQDTSKQLIDDGRFNVTLTPDFTIRDKSGTVRLVGDAKWKQGTPPNADFYQIAAYQQAHDAPGILAYPSQAGAIADSCRLTNGQHLELVELPTSESHDAYSAFQQAMTSAMETAINSVLK